MRHFTSCMLVAILGFGGSCASIPQTGWGRVPSTVSVRTNARVGIRSTDHDIFDSHPVIGVEVTTQEEGRPFGLEFGMTAASDDGDTLTASHDVDFYEGYVGIRKVWSREMGRYYPFVGIGGTYMKIDRKIESGGGVLRAEDWGGGVYLHAGAYTVVGRSTIDGGVEFVAGADLRAVFSDDIDFIELSVVFGVGR